LITIRLRAEIVTIFEPKMVIISARNTNIHKICKLCKTMIFFDVMYSGEYMFLIMLSLATLVYNKICKLPLS
jgi:hypothetical protein